MSENRQPDFARARAQGSRPVPEDLTKEALVKELSEVMVEIRKCAESSYDRPAAKAGILGRYADTLVRAIATLYPQKQQLELSKAPEWETLTPQERLAQIERQRELLAVMEHETTLLLPETSGHGKPEE